MTAGLPKPRPALTAEQAQVVSDLCAGSPAVEGVRALALAFAQLRMSTREDGSHRVVLSRSCSVPSVSHKHHGNLPRYGIALAYQHRLDSTILRGGGDKMKKKCIAAFPGAPLALVVIICLPKSGSAQAFANGGLPSEEGPTRSDSIAHMGDPNGDSFLLAQDTSRCFSECNEATVQCLSHCNDPSRAGNSGICTRSCKRSSSRCYEECPKGSAFDCGPAHHTGLNACLDDDNPTVYKRSCNANKDSCRRNFGLR
jgi:hypothetical protein